MEKKSLVGIIISIILLIVIYSILTFFMKFSFYTYSVIHLVIALLVVLIFRKIDDTKKTFIRKGLILSLSVGIVIFLLNWYLFHLATSPALNFQPFFNAPDPLIYAGLLIVLFNLPFILYSKTTLKTTIITSLILILVIGSVGILNNKIGCISFKCTEQGCVCEYKTSCPECETFDDCPSCSNVCESKDMVEYTGPGVETQRTIGLQIQCACNCVKP